MGTNYYIVCKCCGSHMKHIGKSSMGWPFTSNYADIGSIIYDLEEMNNISERTSYGDRYEIRDEYGTSRSIEEFKTFVEGRTFHGAQMGWLKVDGEFS